MKVLILTADSNGGYPVPAVKGGAVSTLIEHLVVGNNKKQLCDMEIVSFYDTEAEKKANSEYPNVKFTWIRIPGVFKLLDKCAFNFIRIAKNNEKAISFRSPFSLLWYIHKARTIVNRTDADKVVIENNIPLAHVMKGSSFKGQWYYHFHNVPRIDAGCREEFQKVTKFLCVSQFVADQITDENSAIGQIEPERTTVLLNCVDTQMFRLIEKNDPKLAELREKYELEADDFILVFVGRLTEEKGPDKVLEAMKSLPENVRCLIVGSLLCGLNMKDAFQEKLHQLASDLGNRAIFIGYIPQTELPYIYNLADVAVLPSMWDEPAGLTNIEAMACGIPVITTDAGGIKEYVKDMVLVIERDENISNSIVNCVLNIMNNEVSFAEPNDKLRNFILDNYKVESYIERFLKLITEN